MAVREFTESDSTRIWELLNEVGTQVGTDIAAVTPGWQSYGVVWGQADGTTLSIMNGSLLGRWTTIGKTGLWMIQWTRGTNTNLGSGTYTFTLPTPSAAWQRVTGSGYLARGTSEYLLGVRPIAAGVIAPLMASGGRVSNSAPGGWTPGDYMVLAGQMELP